MILVAIPYHKAKRYALPHLIDWLESADLSDCEVVMRWDIGEYAGKNAVKKQREFFRRLAIDENADYLYFMDCDTIPPLDTIQRLKAYDKDVVGALYYSRTQAEQTGQTPLAWRDTPDPYGWQQEAGNLVEVDGMGAGAVLFSRRTLTEFNYDYDGDQDDWPVYRQLKQKGYDIYLDKTLTCKHYETADNFF